MFLSKLLGQVSWTVSLTNDDVLVLTIPDLNGDREQLFALFSSCRPFSLHRAKPLTELRGLIWELLMVAASECLVLWDVVFAHWTTDGRQC